MKVENSIKQNTISTTQEPITNTEEIIKAICEWNGITVSEFDDKVWYYGKIGTDTSGNDIFVNHGKIINPIGSYLYNVYEGKRVVFEKWNDKFFWTIRVVEDKARYQIWDKVIEIPYKIRVENDDTWDSIIIFPKTSDFLQEWMKSLYVVNTWWAERQKLEKQIMAKLIELAQIRWWNEIISTQSALEELKQTLKKRWIDMNIIDGCIILNFGRRMLRDVVWMDADYIAGPMQVKIDFEGKAVYSKGYSPHWFGTPNSWWNPCWWNLDNDVRRCVDDCDIKGLINFIINWAYWYNSDDTGRTKDWRHPVWKLKDYIWHLYNDDVEWAEIDDLKLHLDEVRKELNIDWWLDRSERTKEFLDKLENKANETDETK